MTTGKTVDTAAGGAVTYTFDKATVLAQSGVNVGLPDDVVLLCEMAESHSPPNHLLKVNGDFALTGGGYIGEIDRLEKYYYFRHVAVPNSPYVFHKELLMTVDYVSRIAERLQEWAAGSS